MGAMFPWLSMVPLTSPVPVGDSDVIEVPGAATSTHGPASVKAAGAPLESTDPTVSTWSSNQAGVATVAMRWSTGPPRIRLLECSTNCTGGQRQQRRSGHRGRTRVSRNRWPVEGFGVVR